MTEQELREKIVKILEEAYEPIEYGDDDIHGAQIYFPSNEDVANALISEGIGDVSELQKECESKEEAYNKCYYDYKYWKDKAKDYKHRAEVAERALRNAAPRLNCRGGLGKGFCRVDKCDYYHCNNDEGCVKAHLQQAEKELQEERKDD